MSIWFPLSLVTLVFWGITGVTQKLSTRHISSQLAFVWFTVAFIILAVGILLFQPIDTGLTGGLVALAALGGLLNGGGALTSFAALESASPANRAID